MILAVFGVVFWGRSSIFVNLHQQDGIPAVVRVIKVTNSVQKFAETGQIRKPARNWLRVRRFGCGLTQQKPVFQRIGRIDKKPMASRQKRFAADAGYHACELTHLSGTGRFDCKCRSQNALDHNFLPNG